MSLPRRRVIEFWDPAPDYKGEDLKARITSDSEFGTPEWGGTVDVAAIVAPEPSTWAMMLVGFAAIGGVFRRRRA